MSMDITPHELRRAASAMLNAIVIAHGKSDEYTRGAIDAITMLTQVFSDDTISPVGPWARDAVREWEFAKSPASKIVIPPGEP